MRLDWPRTTRIPAWPKWSVAVVVGWLGMIFLIAYVLRPAGLSIPVCWFRHITGIPCPACGLTRGVQHTLAGQPVTGLSYNPLFMVLLGGMGVYLVIRLATGRTVRVSLSRSQRILAWIAFSLLLLANWAYVIFEVH